MTVTYCSFAEPNKFLGAVVIPGSPHVVMVSILLHMRKLNPGGELVAVTVDDSAPEHEWLAANPWRLIGADELRQQGYLPVREWEEQETNGNP